MITKTFDENGKKFRITVHLGLRYIRGNSAPYFSITADIDRKDGNGKWVEDSCGCLHDEIAKHFPGQFDDLIALHLSDINGVPMHAEANGWYWLEGAAGGMGSHYHGSNGTPKSKSETECLEIFARHCRIDRSLAARIVEDCKALGIEAGRAHWRKECNGLRANWNIQAQQCIQRNNLVVTGDYWEAS